MKMVLRQRRKPVAQIVTELDAFPKVPDTYVEYTLSGAYGKSIIAMHLHQTPIISMQSCHHPFQWL